MDKQPVGQLPDLTQSNNDDEIMVITNSEYNQLKKEKILDFITDLTSTDENNAIVKGIDGKLFTKDFGNASNITEGTLPVSVLPDIPKDKLPEIETDDLPDSGITAGTYTYPTDIVVNSKGQVTSITEGQAGANNANQDLSNLGPLGLDKINQSKALETGSVSSDADVFAVIQKYAHSTFNKSKFTVVGSPNITDDGIASGFSSSNFIRTAYTALSQNFKIYLPKFNSSDVTTTQNILRYSDGNVRAQINDSKIRLFRYTDIKEYDLPIGTTSLENNKDYYYYIEHTTDGEKYYLKGYIRTEDTDWSIDVNLTSKKPMYDRQNNAPIQLSGVDATFPFIGSLDLKQFSIIVDSKEIFNGNKTGLYIAKPDNYEVVGSPTITEDGVVSNLSLNNCVKITNLDFSKGKVIYDIAGTLNNVNESGNSYLSYFQNDTEKFSLLQVKNNTGLQFATTINGQATYGSVLVPSDLYGKFSLHLEMEENSSTYKLINNGTTSTGTLAIGYSSFTKPFTSCTVGSITLLNFSGSIDLNSIKVYSNGNLTYQPCLKIPYTESKTGSKIVDVAYRDRVQDLYEQTGEALFYTLDEENQDFTLPASDIYGMITKNREILDIVYPIGRPMPEENNVLLDNEVWLEGATVNIVDYPKLFKVYGTKYGGDGTTTFKLPDMRGRVLWGSPDGSNGYIESKLPNIKGSCGKFDVYEASGKGCFNISSQTYGNTREQWGGSVAAIGFNASRSNSIYSDSAKIVQPPAFKVRWKTRFE